MFKKLLLIALCATSLFSLNAAAHNNAPQRGAQATENARIIARYQALLIEAEQIEQPRESEDALEGRVLSKARKMLVAEEAPRIKTRIQKERARISDADATAQATEEATEKIGNLINDLDWAPADAAPAVPAQPAPIAQPAAPQANPQAGLPPIIVNQNSPLHEFLGFRTLAEMTPQSVRNKMLHNQIVRESINRLGGDATNDEGRLLREKFIMLTNPLILAAYKSTPERPLTEKELAVVQELTTFVSRTEVATGPGAILAGPAHGEAVHADDAAQAAVYTRLENLEIDPEAPAGLTERGLVLALYAKKLVSQAKPDESAEDIGRKVPFPIREDLVYALAQTPSNSKFRNALANAEDSNPICRIIASAGTQARMTRDWNKAQQFVSNHKYALGATAAVAATATFAYYYHQYRVEAKKDILFIHDLCDKHHLITKEEKHRLLKIRKEWRYMIPHFTPWGKGSEKFLREQIEPLLQKN